MNIIENIYGALFMGAMSVGLFYCAYVVWSDNPTFSIFLGFFGIILGFYSIGLFLIPSIIDSFKKIKRRKK